MRWERLGEAAELLGLTNRSLRSRGERETWPRRRDGHQYEYCVPQSRQEAEAAGLGIYFDGVEAVEVELETVTSPATSAAPTSSLDFNIFKSDVRKPRKKGKPAPAPTPNFESYHDDVFDDEPEDYSGDTSSNDAAIDVGDDGVEDYFYNKASDRYVFNLDSLGGKAFPLPGTAVRRIAENYSNLGHKNTIAELCRSQKLSRPVAREILKRLGIQHDSLPFTPEELRDRDEDDLVSSVLQLKSQKVYVKAERALWRETLKKAENWDRLDHQIIRPLIEEMRHPPASIKRPKPSPHDDEFAAFIMPSDLHVGKFGWQLETGSDYNIEITRGRLMSALDDLERRLLKFGRPTKILTGVGSDYFHVDNYFHGTTRGTSQDMDGTTAKMIKEGLDIWSMFIERLRTIAPVEMFAMSGNHDKILSYCMIEWCSAYWRMCDDVTVNVSPKDRSYTMVGNTLVGISHSEDTKHKELPNLMAVEAPELWGRSKHRVWFTGHWHADMTQEMRGTKVHVIPSLAGSDRWHARNGYIGNQKILPAYVLDHRHGEVAQINGIPDM